MKDGWGQLLAAILVLGGPKCHRELHGAQRVSKSAMMLPAGLEKWGLRLLTIPAPLRLEIMLDDQGHEVKPLESLRWAVDSGRDN